MGYDPFQFVIRRPRHSAMDGTVGRVWLEVDSADVPPQNVRLHDFSRKGAKIELEAPIPPKASLRLCVLDESLGLDVQIPGRVCWIRTEGVGCWMLGCSFEESVPYEVIGELFLSGVLSTVSPSE